MKKFGSYAIVTPVKHELKLEPSWYWMIRPPLGKDEIEVSRILSTDKFRIEADGTRVSMLPTNLEIAIREIATTFGGTNIPMSETDPSPILPDGATVVQVEEVLKEMPRDLILELWAAVGDAVPGWGPRKAAKAPKAEAKTDGDAKN